MSRARQRKSPLAATSSVGIQNVVCGQNAQEYADPGLTDIDRLISTPTVSNRHCLFFNENKLGDNIAVVEGPLWERGHM